MAYPKSLNNLISSFKDLPGVGEKTAERMALTMLNFEKNKLDSFAKAIINVKDKIKRCSICNNLTEDEICDICSDTSRDENTICVVEDVKNVMLFEKNGLFNGKYHVLNGLISPVDGIDPSDINIQSLLDRVKKENTKEIIIAVKPSLEGEATALYISKKLEGNNVIVSKIAHGVPMGADMEYIDAMTLETALFDRKKVS
ncbi:MAG: recombination mediator RecR [Bacilli bacterium]|mgnify:CR=1 FL=1|nr:recombination mediator RecR [Bacilli bacterium]MDD4411362.1 recombination mediator RecR [Bacilli bacterium]